MFIKLHLVKDYEVRKVLWKEHASSKIKPYLKYKDTDVYGLSFPQNDVENPIWIYWNKGIEQAPIIVQKCYESVLGFEYLKVSTKDQYFDCLPKIVSNEKQDRTLVVEIVVNSENEDAALNLIGSIMVDESNAAKAAIKKAIGKKGIDAIKKMMGR